MAKLVDRAIEEAKPLYERMGWCEFLERKDSQRDGVVYFFCHHEESKKRPMAGATERCMLSDQSKCPFVKGGG